MNKYLNQIICAAIIILVVYSCAKSESEIEDENREYTKKIERIAGNNFESGLIEKAEKYYPERQEVVAAASNWVSVPDTGYWFYESFDGVYIPYAITKEAVYYYSNIIEDFNQNKKDNFFLTASFSYTATVSFEENYQSPSANSVGEPAISQEFESVYIVEMKLEWEQYCGSLCAMWIDKERIVIFNESGELLAVFLDGPISVPVS